MDHIQGAKERDPLKKDAVKEEGSELSPMDPPDAYAPPATVEQVPYEKMPLFMRDLFNEHKPFREAIDRFEAAILGIPEKGITREFDAAVRDFFWYFDNEFEIHNQKEEKRLFGLLHDRLVAKGEHSQGPEATTAVDVLEGDHKKAVQLAAVIFNFFALSHRLPDLNSRLVVLDAALEQSKELIELLRLHIYREESIVFQMALQLISTDEFDLMALKSNPNLKN